MFTHVDCYSFAWSTDSIRFIATQSRCGRAKRHRGISSERVSGTDELPLKTVAI